MIGRVFSLRHQQRKDEQTKRRFLKSEIRLSSGTVNEDVHELHCTVLSCWVLLYVVMNSSSTQIWLENHQKL